MRRAPLRAPAGSSALTPAAGARRLSGAPVPARGPARGGSLSVQPTHSHFDEALDLLQDARKASASVTLLQPAPATGYIHHQQQQQQHSSHLYASPAVVIGKSCDSAEALAVLRDNVLDGPRGIQLMLVEHSGSALLDFVMLLVLLQEDLREREAGSESCILFQPCLQDVGSARGSHALLVTKAKCPSWAHSLPSHTVCVLSMPSTAVSQVASRTVSHVLEHGMVRLHCAPGPTALGCAFMLMKAARRVIKAAGSELLVAARLDNCADESGREAASIVFDVFRKRVPAAAPPPQHVATGAASGRRGGGAGASGGSSRSSAELP